MLLAGDSYAGAPVPDLTLIFPAGLPGSQRYRERAQAAGRKVMGASSLAFDPASRAYEDWAVLPYVHEPSFADAVGELVGARGVTAIFSPHEVVSGVLAGVLPRVAPGVRLIEANPMLQAEAAYRRSLAQAETAVAWLDGAGPCLSAVERAGLVRLVDTIPGMTDLDKIDAVIEIMRSVPPGDMVEIGSWWGRSAALFLLLARRYAIGPVLCVDPWRSDCLAQGVPVLDQASARLDPEQAFRIFQMNLSPLAQGDLNYIRASSAEAACRYGPGLAVTTDAFGTTRFDGRIALLHIDGNHSHEQADADARLWTPHVRPGGWIIFDDYVWSFGDGPRRAGDAFLRSNAARVARSFVMGTALFVQLVAA